MMWLCTKSKKISLCVLFNC